ncbi:MAG: Rieske (2Fe-2S) protein [Bauldia sp.]
MILRLSEIPEDTLRPITIGGQDAVLVRRGNQCFAFGGECTHEGAPLADGELDGDTIVCPWHFSRFDIRTGAVVEDPADDPISVFAVTIDGDTVTIVKD